MLNLKFLIPVTTLLTTLLACGNGGDADDTGSGAGAATSTIKLVSGHFGGSEVDLVVNDGVVNGHVYSTVGDPARGGATCEFTFRGQVATTGTADEAQIVAVDGFESVAGTIRARRSEASGLGAFEMFLADSPGACSRVFGDQLKTGFAWEGTSPLEAGTVGYRSIKANKAFFHDAPGGPPRKGFVVKGQTVVVSDASKSGWSRVTFLNNDKPSSTSGFIAEVDLAGFEGKASPLVGHYSLDSTAVSANLQIRNVTSDEILFDLEGVINSGSNHNGAIVSGHAQVAGNKATFKEGSDCELVMTLDPAKGSSLDVKQTGTCSEGGGFGAFLDVSGHYGRTDPNIKPAMGRYTLESRDVSARVDIRDVAGDEVIFDLEGVINSGSNHNGAIVSGHAKLRGPVATYTDGSDCEIAITLDPTLGATLDVKQTGPCSEGGGFGAFLDVSGHYHRDAATAGR